VFENRVLRSMFRHKREKVVRGWRRFHSKERHNLCPSPNIIRVVKSRWAGHAARVGDMSNAFSILVGKPEGKIPLGRPRRIWENIRMLLSKVCL
jgi:hypothetical protein